MNRTMKVSIVTFAFLVMLSIPTTLTTAKIWYVDDSGGTGINFTSIQPAIDNATNGDTIIVYNGTYQEDVKVIKQLNLTGVGMPVVDACGSGCAITMSANGCILQGFKTVNSGIRKDAGIYVKSHNNVVSGNNANSNCWYGIYLYYSNNNTISNNNANLNYFDGICLYHSSNNTISNNIANSNNNRGIYLDGSDTNTISNNNANSNNRDGIYLKGSSYNTISNNSAYLDTDTGIYLDSSNYNIILNNNINSNGEDGVYLDNSRYNTISSNNANSNGIHGIHLYESVSNILSNNNANSNRKDGIFLFKSSNHNTISNNNASSNDDGIYLGHFSNYNIISNNEVLNEDDGIFFERSSNNIISNNNASNNYIGISLLFLCNNNTLLNNNIYSNKFYGIFLTESSRNTILNNNVYFNKYGVFLYHHTEKNILYHNNLISNTNSNARDDDCNNNQWYNSTIYEGNYYSDYTGTDLDENGIGDIPYNISGTSGFQDLYPLMQPFSENLPPMASFNYYPENPVVNQTITFNATNSTDPDGFITKYEWDFGDGNVTDITTIQHSYPLARDYNVSLTVTDNDGATNTTTKTITVYPLIAVFDTGPSKNPYPCISGTHKGTITPSKNTPQHKLYTYPCPGTGGHTEYVWIYGNGVNESASWNSYSGDWHYIHFDKSFMLEEGKTYNYIIITDSYPQIIHAREFNARGGKITCTEFRDANGKGYDNWIPAIRLE